MISPTLTSIIPRLPSRNLEATKEFYTDKLGFKQAGGTYPDYLMMRRDGAEIHFFLFRELDVRENYGMCYIRVENIDRMYEEFKTHLPSLKAPELKMWNQKEMYVLDPDHNSLAFGEGA